MRSYYDHVYEACRLQSRLYEASERMIRDRRARDAGAVVGLLARFYVASLDPRTHVAFLRDVLRKGYRATVLSGTQAAVEAMIGVHRERVGKRNDG